MNEDLKKMEELLMADENCRTKLKEAFESYTGENTEEEVFNNVLVPFAKEYGITASFEDFKAYIEKKGQAVTELDASEMAQVTGGGSYDKGVGAAACFLIGAGVGVVGILNSDFEGGNICWWVGIGEGAQACLGEGYNSGAGVTPGDKGSNENRLPIREYIH